ncbi:E3 ubiquitin-protein ligase parkin-like [Pollicipes pollicipes]|uniref:E3 ubiquitin-protein ligase parkin-like n=1 Tax=Pollicipes pollicipes TaxID=41117 RepID=UPI0018855275|nr:E3 ubiquitin-protein ligase parkin-like [Pollicipes pollicipes]
MQECVQEGAFTVRRDPCSWEDVLLPRRVPGTCDTAGCDGDTAQFFFKCGEHASLGEEDQAVPLDLVRNNLRQIPCLACADTADLVVAYPCPAGHVTCLECFVTYCRSRLDERQFVQDAQLGYTLGCPAGCQRSLITEAHHFRLMGDQQYERYQRFATEECLLQAGGVLCPRPDCGMGLLPDELCRRVQCQQGCGFVFCRDCLQGYHMGECDPAGGAAGSATDGARAFGVDEVAQARWEEATRTAIQVLTKPCPKCRTPTERDGGCMHMICPRSQCGYHWCWVCQTEWTRECMGNHWFG